MSQMKLAVLQDQHLHHGERLGPRLQPDHVTHVMQVAREQAGRAAQHRVRGA